MEDKIKISKVSKKCYLQKGFDGRGCYGCACCDVCCQYGADFDKVSYDLIVQNRDMLEPLLEQTIEQCFEDHFSNDPEFLGKNSIRSLTGANGFCAFHKKNGKGCILYELANENKVEKKIIPSICRMFPISWKNGKLIVYDEQENICIPDTCNCSEIENITSQTIWDTQKNSIVEIFDIWEIPDVSEISEAHCVLS